MSERAVGNLELSSFALCKYILVQCWRINEEVWSQREEYERVKPRGVYIYTEVKWNYFDLLSYISEARVLSFEIMQFDPLGH